MIDFKGHHFEKDIILTCVCWYLAYSLSYRNLEEMMEERGVRVDHSNIYRWVQKFTPQLEAAFRKGKKRPVGDSWRMDETYIKINGQWKYLYRAVDKAGQTVDFLLTARRNKKAARHFFEKAIGQHGLPEKVTIDKSGSNSAALEVLKEETGAEIEIRQIKYLNNFGRAGSPGHQTNCPTHARLQNLQLGPPHLAWHRTDSHDQERPDGRY